MAKSRSKLNCIFYPISPLASQDKHINALELKRVILSFPTSFQIRLLRALSTALCWHFQALPPCTSGTDQRSPLKCCCLPAPQGELGSAFCLALEGR